MAGRLGDRATVVEQPCRCGGEIVEHVHAAVFQSVLGEQLEQADQHPAPLG